MRTCSNFGVSRFPFPIPLGWFQIAYPEDLAPGEVKPVKYWGRDLVLWRDESGQWILQDAFCPHLGAHLGHGGSVHADKLQCPFHGWQYDGDGRCTSVPYSEKLNRKAFLRTYPVVERNRLIVAWYHPNDEPPSFELPIVEQLSDPAFTEYIASETVIQTCLQEMAENTVDPAHFRYVHGTEDVAVVESYTQDGPRATMLSAQKYVTPRGVVEGRIDVFTHGPGFSMTWFRGIIDALLVAAATPIDEESAIVRFNFTVRNPDRDEITTRLGDAFVSMINQQLHEDQPIWEHKAHLPVPALADKDGPIMAFRKWYAQFYAA
jgi:3-ketosteroid 9alpha-monooxygenase subunit A